MTKGKRKLTLAQRTKQFTRDLMIHVLNDDTDDGVPLVLQVVASGPVMWRIEVLRVAAQMHLAVDETIADMLFHFFSEQVVRRYNMPAGKVLDKLEVSTPLSEREFQDLVDRSWTWECGSSQAARRLFRSEEQANALFGRGRAIGVTTGSGSKDS